MKILILNSTDIIGGAARAAYRIHKGLLSQDIDSTMLVQTKACDDPPSLGPLEKKTEPLINFGLIWILCRYRYTEIKKTQSSI